MDILKFFANSLLIFKKFSTALEIAIPDFALLVTRRDKSEEIHSGALGKNFSALCLEITKDCFGAANVVNNSALGK